MRLATRLLPLALSLPLALACLAGVGCAQATSVTSPYQLADILSLEPQDIPETLEHLGFSYEQGAPVGMWENRFANLPVSPDGSRTCLLFNIGNGETSPDLMSSGTGPKAISMSITAPWADEEERATVCTSLLIAAGLDDEAYFDSTTDTAFDRTYEVRAGRCPEGSAASVWMLWTISENSGDYASTTYSLGVYTAEGAASCENDGMQEALEAMGMQG